MLLTLLNRVAVAKVGPEAQMDPMELVLLETGLQGTGENKTVKRAAKVMMPWIGPVCAGAAIAMWGSRVASIASAKAAQGKPVEQETIEAAGGIPNAIPGNADMPAAIQTPPFANGHGQLQEVLGAYSDALA